MKKIENIKNITGDDVLKDFWRSKRKVTCEPIDVSKYDTVSYWNKKWDQKCVIGWKVSRQQQAKSKRKKLVDHKIGHYPLRICSYCNYVANTYDEWIQHINDPDHVSMVAVNAPIIHKKIKNILKKWNIKYYAIDAYIKENFILKGLYETFFAYYKFIQILIDNVDNYYIVKFVIAYTDNK
eukprot:37329_1